MCIEGSSVGFVCERSTFTFVHRIVSNQFALVSGESFHKGLGNLIGCQRLGPQTYLHHVSGKASTDGYRCATIELNIGFERSDQGIRNLFGTGVEAYQTVLTIIDHGYTGKAHHLLRQGIGVDGSAA